MKRFLFAIGLSALLIFSFSVEADAAIYTVWADSVADGTLQKFADLKLGTINSYNGPQTGKNNYDYTSFSGHPIHGPNTHPNRLKIFIYRRTTNGRNFLNAIAGADNGGTQHRFALDFLIKSSNLDPSVVQGDEPREVSETAPNFFEGRWRFNNNTDGAVLGPIKGKNWIARITPIRSTLNRHVFASNGTDNIRFDNLGYDHYYITPGLVPEPATMLLFGTGLIGGAFVRRRNRS